MRSLWCRFVLAIVLVCSGLLPAVADEPPQPAHAQVIVVGGGIAGLVTAWKLEQKGYTTCVLEQSDHLGGRIATAHYPGNLEAEYGMQEIWEKSPLLGIVKQLGLELEATDDAWSSLIIDDHIHAFVEDKRDDYLNKLFTPAERKVFDQSLKAMEASYREATTRGLTPATLRLQRESYHDWLKARHLPHKVEEALRLTIECELASSADEFSALSAILEYRTFLFGGERNYHVKGGNGRIIETLAEAIKGQKILNAQVTHVVRHRDHGHLVAEVRYQQDGQVHTVTGDAVVVAIPWVFLHSVQFQPALTATQQKAIYSLGRGQYTVVHMLLDRGVTALWKNAGGNPFPILSDGVLGVIYGPHATDTAGPDIVFSLLIYGPQATAYHMNPLDNKRAQVLAGLDHYWPGFSRFVHGSWFYTYHPCAVTYWPTGRSPLDALSEAVRTPHEGLFLAGDWTESSHSEGAVVSALKSAEKVDRFLHAGRAAR